MRRDVFTELSRRTKLLQQRKTVYPVNLDIHPVMNACNLKCAWCIGQSGEHQLKPAYMDFEDYQKFFESIFKANRRDDWPREIHVCGSNAEPTLGYERFVKWFVEMADNRTDVKLITNGVLLHRVFDSLNKFADISISLDLMSAKAFKEKKGADAFDQILDNIKNAGRLRSKSTMVYTTFVLDGKPDMTDKEIFAFFEKLIGYGVNHLHFRPNYFSNEGIENYVVGLVKKLRDYFGLPEDFNCINADTEHVCIKYNDYLKTRTPQPYCACMMNSLWPTIAANKKVYPCAHVANETSRVAGIPLDLSSDYYAFFESIQQSKANFIQCADSHLCPSVAYFTNHAFAEYASRNDKVFI